jgi:hypothetical protein
MKRVLPQAKGPGGLGLPTIMDRELAGTYGVPYVHLAVFAIDIDRVYWLDPELASLPFGWEVFLTERYLSDNALTLSEELLEAVCQPLLDETPGEPPLGGQIVFAVFAAVQRGALPGTLGKLFAHWRNPPGELLDSLTQLRGEPAALLPLCRHCLSAELDPPLAPPTRAALEAIAAAVSGK